MKQIIKRIIKFFCLCADRFLSLRHVSCKTRVELASAFRKAMQEFVHNGQDIQSFDRDPSKLLGRIRFLPEKQRILVDVSQIVMVNARSGIQRVVVKLLDAMLKDQRYVYVPIACFYGQMYYVEYYQEDCSFHLVKHLQFMEKDILLMLDSSWEYYKDFRKVFKQLHSLNGRVCMTVYDLVPILQPQFTVAEMPGIFKNWLHAAVLEADSVLCISSTVAEQLRDYICRNHIPIWVKGLKVGHFYLGADFPQVDSRSIDPAIADILERVKNKKKFLSVSTLEPRKNYVFMLNVIEKLWEKGFDIVYFIVGKKGWDMDNFICKITRHPEWNKRLFWFPFCNDSSLQQLYLSSDVLLNLSNGEGYGLSLVEGAHYGCSVIASDIPVFREIITDNTTLFCNIDSQEDTVNKIAQKLKSGQLVPSSVKHYLWKDSLDQILDALFHDKWDFTLH